MPLFLEFHSHVIDSRYQAFRSILFPVENIAGLPRLNGHEAIMVKLILPGEISLYNFEYITYVVDVYREVCLPLKNSRDYFL